MQNHTPALRNARRLRGEMSLPQVLLRGQLRQRASDVNFRRRHPIGNFIVDCCCVERKLVVDIDGKSHDMGHEPDRDGRRDEWLRSREFHLVGLRAEDVLRDVPGAAESLVMLALVSPPPSVAGATATSPGGRGFLEGVC